jgi:hypothetical protein
MKEVTHTRRSSRPQNDEEDQIPHHKVWRPPHFSHPSRIFFFVVVGFPSRVFIEAFDHLICSAHAIAELTREGDPLDAFATVDPPICSCPCAVNNGESTSGYHCEK